MARRIAELEAELKVRTDIMNITSLVSEADKKCDMISINEKFIEVSKHSRAELIGQPHSAVRHPGMPKATFKDVARNNPLIYPKELGCTARRKTCRLASQTSGLQRSRAPKSDGANGESYFLPPPEPQSGVFKRVGKNGVEVYLQAVYAPVMDEMNRVIKIIKIATDVTADVQANNMLRQAVDQAQHVTSAAMLGDLSQRISMDGKSGRSSSYASALTV